MGNGSAGGVLRNGDFRRLWAGESVSILGSEVTLLALPLTAVLALHASAAEVGMLNAAKFAPFLVLSLPAGAWVDRWRRRPVLLVANLASAVVLAAVPVMAASGRLGVASLSLIAFLAGTFAVFLHVGFWSYVPSLVEDEQLMEANSKLLATASAASVAGPGVGGILVQLFSGPGALLFDATSFLFAAGALLRIRRREPPVQPRPRRLVAEIRDGLRCVFGSPYLRAFAGEAAMFNLFASAMTTVFLVYAVRVLELSPGPLGVVLGASALGSAIGSLVARRLQEQLTLGGAIVWAMVLGTWPYLLVPFAGSPGLRSMVILAIGFFTSGIGIGIAVVLVMTVRQSVTPERMLGRMNASYRFVGWGAIAAGSIVGGGLAATLGLRPALVVSVIGIALAPVWIVLSPIPRLRTVEDAVAGTHERPVETVELGVAVVADA